jgi:murein DD-endopeptidase MepM/ murein hydrolase activator NlpD
MKIYSTILFALFLSLFFTDIKVFAQEVEEEDNNYLIESINDSIDIRANFYDDSDSLSEFFPAYSLYESWDNEGIHYPKVDFSKKNDTTIVVLCDDKTNFYCIPKKGKINSDYGWRRRRYHYGIDIDIDVGDTIKCAFDGMVRVSRRHKGYGNVIVVRHFNGLETIYAHLLVSRVQENQVVKAGEMLGLGGNTGRSTGPHLHFETRYLGTPFNPKKIIDFDNNKLISDTLLISKYTFENPKKSKTNYTKTGTNNKTASYRSSGGVTYYYVKSGDTLGRIASIYGTSVSAICRLNGFTDKKLLQIGQKIRVR